MSHERGSDEENYSRRADNHNGNEEKSLRPASADVSQPAKINQGPKTALHHEDTKESRTLEVQGGKERR